MLISDWGLCEEDLALLLWSLESPVDVDFLELHGGNFILWILISELLLLTVCSLVCWADWGSRLRIGNFTFNGSRIMGLVLVVLLVGAGLWDDEVLSLQSKTLSPVLLDVSIRELSELKRFGAFKLRLILDGVMVAVIGDEKDSSWVNMIEIVVIALLWVNLLKVYNNILNVCWYSRHRLIIYGKNCPLCLILAWIYYWERTIDNKWGDIFRPSLLSMAMLQTHVNSQAKC